MKHYIKEAEMKKKVQEPLVEKLHKESPKKKSPKKTVKSAPTKKKCPKGSKLNKKQEDAIRTNLRINPRGQDVLMEAVKILKQETVKRSKRI